MRKFLASLLVLVSTIPLNAQTIGQLDPLLEDQRQQALEQRTNDLGALTARGGVPDPGPVQDQGGPCFQINQLDVTGATIVSQKEIAAITRPYVPGCMEGADIQAVMRKIDSLYAEQGYITTKTYIPPQNLTEGHLTLSVIEGQVEELILLDAKGQVETARGRRQLATAFPGVKNRPFQLRDFEQGLDQMNRLHSVEAVMRLQPGYREGGSHALIQRIQNDRFRGYLRTDTLGSQSTGKRRLSLDTEIDDLFGANDAWNFGYTGSLNTNALTLRGSIPHGYLTYGLDFGYSEYLVPLNEFSEVFGTSRTARFDLHYMLNRDQFTTTELNGTLSLLRSARWINDVRLTPQALTVLKLGITHMRLDDLSRQSWDVNLHLGLPLFGADRDKSGDNAAIPKAQFAKLEFGWQRQAAFGGLGTLVNDMRGQFSIQSLYSSQQLSLGSWSTIRGYTESVAAGDSGIYIRNDLYLASDLWSRGLPKNWRGNTAPKLQPHLFVDAGLAHDKARKSIETAAGLGLGLSWYGKRFTASALAGVPLLSDNQFKIGSPVIQLRMDMKTW